MSCDVGGKPMTGKTQKKDDVFNEQPLMGWGSPNTVTKVKVCKCFKRKFKYTDETILVQTCQRSN